MKKWLIALSMSLCLLSLTACGSQEEVSYLSDSDALQEAGYDAQMVASIIQNDMVDEYVYQMEQQYGMGTVMQNACDSMTSAIEEMGNLVQVGDLVSNSVELDKLGNPYEGTIEVTLEGTERDATFEVVFERGDYKSFTTNVNYSFGESMGKAGLNTLIGMGTVFIVLILISLIISLFGFIPKIQAAFSKKPAESAKEKAVDATIEQIVANEELSDDTELVAVISAAIAAYEGSSGDGFVVRSIRRAR